MPSKDVFTAFKYFGVTCKVFGLGPYVTKNKNNGQWEQKVTLIDTVILISLVSVTSVLNYCALFEKYTYLTGYESFGGDASELFMAYFAVLCTTLIFLFFGIKNRIRTFEILYEINTILDEIRLFNVNINFQELTSVAFNIFLILLAFLFIFLVIHVILFVKAYMNLMYYILTSVIQLLLECQFIFCLLISCSILRVINNEMLNLKSDIGIIPVFNFKMFNLCRLINMNFNHIIVKFFLNVLFLVVWGCWFMVTIVEDNFSTLQMICACVWILVNNLGTVIILFFCSLIDKEVSYVIPKF